MPDRRGAGTPRLHVLLLENSAVAADLILQELRRGGYEPVARRVASRREMLEALTQGPWQIVLLDYSLEGGGTALEALASLAELHSDLPAILISGPIGVDEAAAALHAGARDFVSKRDLTRLVPAVTRELARIETRREHELAVEALRESEQRFRLITEYARDLIALLDQEGRYHYVSPAAASILGYHGGDLLGKDASELIHPDDWPAGGRWGTGELREMRMRKRDGSWGLVEVLSYEVPMTKEPQFALIARDISERKRAEATQLRLEAEIRQYQKMEAVGQLAAGIAHDFNNLLTVIKGYTDILLVKLGRDAPVSKEVAEVAKAADAAARLTRQLLAFSRKQMLAPRVIALNDVVTEALKMLGRLVAVNIDVRTTLAEDLGTVSADAGQLEQVIMNLVVNSIDAMPKGGDLLIETANVSFDEAEAARHEDVAPGEYVMLAVTDTGRGMDAATAGRIFEPFYTTKERGAGTGLGLSTVYGIVKQSSGHIELESEPGMGTTFRLYLPRMDAEPEAFTPEPPRVRSLVGSETVLLVEDDDALRELGREMLQAYGYTVLLAADGAAALELAQNHPDPILLLMTDIMMPRMGGIELAERLSTQRPELKILYTSGYNDGGSSLERLAGARYVQKPYAMEDLARIVRELLDSPASRLWPRANRL